MVSSSTITTVTSEFSCSNALSNILLKPFAARMSTLMIPVWRRFDVSFFLTETCSLRWLCKVVKYKKKKTGSFKRAFDQFQM